MNPARRRFVVAGAIAVGALSVGACAPHMTKDLFSDHPYTEQIETFAMTGDRSKLVVIGQTRHYIFDIPPNLANILESPVREYLTARFWTFTVDAGAVSGSFTLSLRKDAPDDIRRRAAELGFARSGQLLTLDEEIAGKVFNAGNDNVAAHVQRFNRPYSIQVRQRLSAGQKIALLPLTPLTLAADGVVVIGQVPLIILIAPFLAFSGPWPAFR